MDPHELITIILLLRTDNLTNCNKIALVYVVIALFLEFISWPAGWVFCVVLAKRLKSFLLQGPKKYFL